MELHVAGEPWERGLFDRNFDAIRTAEKRTWVSEKYEDIRSNVNVNIDGTNFTRTRTHIAAQGRWCYLNVEVRAARNITVPSTGKLSVKIGSINSNMYRPPSDTVMVNSNGVWARAVIEGSTGDIYLTRATADISSGFTFKFAVVYPRHTVHGVDTPAFPTQPTTFDLGQYNDNLEVFDKRIDNATEGHSHYDIGPVGTQGMINPLEGSIETISTNPSSLIRFGNICFINMVGRLKTDVKSDGNGLLHRHLWTFTNRLNTKYEVGMGSGGAGTNESIGAFGFRAAGGNITLRNATHKNNTYAKGTVINMSGTFIIK